MTSFTKLLNILHIQNITYNIKAQNIKLRKWVQILSTAVLILYIHIVLYVNKIWNAFISLSDRCNDGNENSTGDVTEQKNRGLALGHSVGK